MASLSDKVFQDIRNGILNGSYENGKELTEIGLAKELGVSRTPVREALRQLELEGLVNMEPNKGAVVSTITPKDVMDIYKIRSYLEGLCGRWVAENITKEEFQALEETVFLSEFHEKKGDYEQVFELDSVFHAQLYDACHSRMLAHSLRDFHQYIKSVRRKTVMEKTRAGMCNQEHHQLLDAIRDHDGNRAEELATKHILNSVKNLSQYDLEQILSHH